MTHNFTVAYNTQTNPKTQYMEVPANSQEDAEIFVYDNVEDAIILDCDVDINPAAFEPETDTINQAIQNRLQS